MKKHKFFTVLVILILILVSPAAALAGEDDAAAPLEAGIIQPSEADALIYGLLTDERILNLEAEQAADLKALLNKIQDEPDPLKRELLQKEIQQVKLEHEIAIKERYLDIAVEQGDEVREVEISEALELLYEPEEALPDLRETVQKPAAKPMGSITPLKNPDDS